MKKYLLTGLAILLPLAVTFWIVSFLFNLLTVPFLGITQELLDWSGLLDNGLSFLSGEQIQTYISQFLILAFLLFATVLLGFFARWVFIHYLFQFGDYILHRIPLIKSIYKTSQDVVKALFLQDTKAFKQVVMVPFPNETSHSIGLVTREDLSALNQHGRIAVFVPTTPNPTSGFLIMFKKEDVTYLDMKVEEALKYVISCGVILTPFRSKDSK